MSERRPSNRGCRPVAPPIILGVFIVSLVVLAPRMYLPESTGEGWGDLVILTLVGLLVGLEVILIKRGFFGARRKPPEQ
jgi:hypothetical protein